MNENSGEFSRVVLWSVPRCLSTAFEKSMRSRGDLKVYHELFSTAAFWGEERIFENYADQPAKPGYTFAEVKQLLESPHPEYSGIFAKEQAFCLVTAGRKDALPDGFRHSFLIRRPVKAITSLYKAYTSAYGKDFQFHLGEVGFREIWELYQYIRDVKGETPVVIDADDLLSDPPTMMKKYCAAVGLEFKESMLSWETGRCKAWDWEDSWYTTVARTNGFIKNPKTEGSSSDILVDVTCFPKYVQEAIEDAQDSYDELYKLRIKP